MRVAIVRQRYTPFGGAERFVARALPALERAGAEVTLIARSWNGWAEGGAAANARPARRVLKVDPPYAGAWLRDASFARAARRAWQRERFDIVQSHERIPGCDVYRAGDGVHRRWIEIRAAGAGALERAGLRANPHHRYVLAAERAMFEHPSLRAVICNSQLVREEILRYFRVRPEQLHIIRNGIDLAQFHPAERAARRTAARAWLGLQARDTAFVFVGSGFARKGLDTALRALAACARPGFRLIAAGRERRARRYARLAARLAVLAQVNLLGPSEDVRALYAAADCFILPTRYDPFPNTALEALAMGVPIIVSTRCGAAEIVRHGENGWRCEPDDPRGLAERMREAEAAVRDPRMTDAARASAERFGLDAMAEQLLALYARLGACRAPGRLQ